MDPVSIGMMALPLLGKLFGGGNDEPPQNAQMNELLRLQTSRMNQANPLYEAMLRLAFSMMPTQARGGLDPSQFGQSGRAMPRPGGGLPPGQGPFGY